MAGIHHHYRWMRLVGCKSTMSRCRKKNLQGKGSLATSLLINNNSNINFSFIHKQTQHFNSSLVENNNMLLPPTNNISVLNDNDFNTLETVELLLQSKSYIANDVSLPYINIYK